MDHTSRPAIFLFDFETTGLKPGVHEPIQVAALLVSPELEELAAFESLIKPLAPQTITPEAMAIHRKPLEVLLAAPHPLEVFTKLKEFAAPAGKAYASGFNVDFDLGFLKVAEERLGLTIDRHDAPIIDARKIYLNAKGLSVYTRGTKLSDLCAKYGIATDGAHDALADVRMTLKLLRALRAEHPEAFAFLPLPEAPERELVALAAPVVQVPDEPLAQEAATELQEPPLEAKVDLILERLHETQGLIQKAADELWKTEPGMRLKILEATESELRDELKELLSSNEELGVIDTPNGKAGYQTSRLVTVDATSVHRLAPKLYDDVVTVRHDVDKVKLERLCKANEKSDTLPKGTLEAIMAEAKVETRRSWICKPQARKDPEPVAPPVTQDTQPETVAASGARPDGCPF